MNKYNLHFYSQNPCNLFINGELIKLIDNNYNFFVDLVAFTNQLIITCEPICDNDNLLIPFSFKLNYENNNVVSSTKNVTIVPYPNLNFDVYLNFKKAIIGNNNIITNKKIGNYNVLTLMDKTSTISIFSGNKNLFSTTTNQLENLEAEMFENLIICYGKTEEENYLLVFNTKTNEAILNNTYNKIEQHKHIIKTLKFENLTLKTAKVCELNLETLELNTYNVFLEDFKPINEPKLIPFSFLEAVKQKDFNLAKTFLHETLNDVSNEKLNQYFKNINQIYYNSYLCDESYCNYTIMCDKPRNFNFYLTNNKITEIEEINLF